MPKTKKKSYVESKEKIEKKNRTPRAKKIHTNRKEIHDFKNFLYKKSFFRLI